MRTPRVGTAAAALSAALVLTLSPQAPTAADPGGRPNVDRCDPSVETPKRQLRADWIASVANIDWPSKPGLTPAQQQAELTALYDQAADRGLNAVIVQVRPTADTFWPSAIEPWSKYLTGTAGQGPGYDPLRFAVREAHERNLEFHAWFNPYRVSQDTNRAALAAGSPARVNPDWVVEYGGKLYYDPGLPQVRELTTDVIMETVRRYDIDGVHFDDYFYPYPVAGQEFDDDASFAAHGGDFPDTEEGRADWRRQNTDLLIQGLDRRIHRAKPDVLFGVSPFAVWRNAGTDPEGSATQAGAQTFDDLYADTRRWVREEWVDYIAPQVYWNIGFTVADYGVLVPWWSDIVEGTDVQLYIGQATYKVGVTPAQSPAWLDPREMTKHLHFNRDYPEVDGDIYFSAVQVRANRLGHMDIVQDEHYSRPALPPVTEGVPGRAPAKVTQLRADRRGDDVLLRWRSVRDADRYAVYAVPGKRADACDLVDAEHLVDVVRGTTWLGDASRRDVTYVVTALDDAHRESKAASATVRERR